MNLTNEQKEIINCKDNIKINAVAGSGKTTTLIQYALARPESRILYLAFNKSVKTEAENKFVKENVKNVRIETAHSLAYSFVVRDSNYELKKDGDYKLHEIVELLKLKANKGDHNSEYLLANHIKKFVTLFCNHEAGKVSDLNYLNYIFDPRAKTFVENFYEHIEKGTRQFLAKMERAEIPITHEFYLKKFQLQNPQLSYDYILFDEGQDASPVMLDVFLKQKATKVIVGDGHQQIYAWRHAINAIQNVNFKECELTTSFRFGEDIAYIAGKCLAWKQHISDYKPIPIKGIGKDMPGIKPSKAYLARTNLALLKRAIMMVKENAVNKIYFEGNLSSYSYASEGASLYDVLNLYSGKRHMIKNPLIKQMGSYRDLQDYADKAEDIELKMLIELVNEYKTELPKLMNLLKEKHVTKEEKHLAEAIFSTVHRAKGMEYDEVTLEQDFKNEEEILKMLNDKNSRYSKSQIEEEINILYVAITRAKSMLNIGEKYIPVFKNINVIPEEVKVEDIAAINAKKTYKADQYRKTNPKAYKTWDKKDDNELENLFCEGVTVEYLSRHFSKYEGVIKSRIKKLELKQKQS